MQKAYEEHTRIEAERWSASVFREIATQAMPRSVWMVEDVPGNHPNGFLPILDTQMAVIGGIFRFKHFSKPMSSLEVTLQRAVISPSAKFNILTQEGNRRLRNYDLEMPWTQKVEYINKLMVSM